MFIVSDDGISRYFRACVQIFVGDSGLDFYIMTVVGLDSTEQLCHVILRCSVGLLG